MREGERTEGKEVPAVADGSEQVVPGLLDVVHGVL